VLVTYFHWEPLDLCMDATIICSVFIICITGVWI